MNHISDGRTKWRRSPQSGGVRGFDARGGYGAENGGESGRDVFRLETSSGSSDRKDGGQRCKNARIPQPGQAEYSMVVAILIGLIMFPREKADGLKDSPNLVRVFSVSCAIALFCSSTSLVMFLSILTSRYSYNDFLLWLPIRLMIGVASLFISIAAMMVAFSASFWSDNHNHQELPLILVVIGLFACVPILCVLLKYRLFVDIVRSTFFRFRKHRRLL